MDKVGADVTPKQQSQSAAQAEQPKPPAAKPDPRVEAPQFVWVSKGYDPGKPNPHRARKPERRGKGG